VRTLPRLAIAGTAVAVTLGGVSPALAATSPSAVPPSGTAVTVMEDGDMLLECEGVLHRFDLHGAGQLTIGKRVTAHDGTPGIVMSTTSENLVGYDPDLGMVTVAEAAPASGRMDSPVPGRQFPAAQAFAQDLTIYFEHSPCDTSGAPATFRTKQAFPLLNTNLTAFPPKNTVYTMLDQVELESVDSPHPMTAQLLQFPVTVSTPAS
jgi:hypothetical protein